MRGVALNSTVLFILLQYLLSYTVQRPKVNRYSNPRRGFAPRTLRRGFEARALRRGFVPRPLTGLALSGKIRGVALNTTVQYTVVLLRAALRSTVQYILYRTVLYGVVHCVVLYCTVPCCTVHTVLHFAVLYCLYCLCCAVLYCTEYIDSIVSNTVLYTHCTIQFTVYTHCTVLCCTVLYTLHSDVSTVQYCNAQSKVHRL